MMFDGKEGKLTCTLLMHLTLYLCAVRSPWFRRIGPWWISRSTINCYCWVLFFYFSSVCLPQDFTEHEIRHIILLNSSTQTRMNRYWLFFVNWKLDKYLNIQVAYRFIMKERNSTCSTNFWNVFLTKRRAVYSLSADCIFWRIHRSPDALNVNSKSNILLIWRNQVERIAPHTRHVHDTRRTWN